jgi:hypothetical protein
MEEMVQPHQSYLMWIVTTLGVNALLLPLCACVSFVLALVLVLRGKGPLAAVALLLIVPLPLMLGFYGALKGSIASFSVLALSDVSPKPSEIAGGVAEALLMPMIGLLLTGPGYLVAVIGACARALRERHE